MSISAKVKIKTKGKYPYNWEKCKNYQIFYFKRRFNVLSDFVILP